MNGSKCSQTAKDGAEWVRLFGGNERPSRARLSVVPFGIGSRRERTACGFARAVSAFSARWRGSRKHQPLRGETDHLAQGISVRALCHKRLQVHLVLGHRCLRKLSLQLNLSEIAGGHPAKLTACYSPMGERSAGQLPSAQLHHQPGHDPRLWRLAPEGAQALRALRTTTSSRAPFRRSLKPAYGNDMLRPIETSL